MPYKHWLEEYKRAEMLIHNASQAILSGTRSRYWRGKSIEIRHHCTYCIRSSSCSSVTNKNLINFFLYKCCLVQHQRKTNLHFHHVLGVSGWLAKCVSWS